MTLFPLVVAGVLVALLLVYLLVRRALARVLTDNPGAFLSGLLIGISAPQRAALMRELCSRWCLNCGEHSSAHHNCLPPPPATPPWAAP